MIILKPTAAKAIRSFLMANGMQKSLRVELQSSGCCDPTLGLLVDTIEPSDIVYQVDGLTFAIHPETEQQFGDFHIAYVEETGKTGFVITSTRPVSEWAGFGVCNIKD